VVYSITLPLVNIINIITIIHVFYYLLTKALFNIFQTLKDINDSLNEALLFLPQFCLGRGLLDLSRNQVYRDAFKKYGNYLLFAIS
jgi:hypothetical protein